MTERHLVDEPQLRALWTGARPDIDRGDHLPPVTRADVETLISTGALSAEDRCDDDTPADHMWQVLADQFNSETYTPTGKQEGAYQNLRETAARLNRDELDPDSQREYTSALSAAVNSGLPRSWVAEATGGRLFTDEVKVMQY